MLFDFQSNYMCGVQSKHYYSHFTDVYTKVQRFQVMFGFME